MQECDTELLPVSSETNFILCCLYFVLHLDLSDEAMDTEPSYSPPPKKPEPKPEPKKEPEPELPENKN
nr:unnamed protein product [Callosobruchus analis]